MKKIKRTAILSMAAVAMLLAACGSVTGGRVDSGEIVVPEMSSEDLLVSSLEYLLQEDGDTTEEKEDVSEAEEPQEAAEEVKEGQSIEDVRKEQGTGVDGSEAVIYYGNAGSFDLDQEIVQLEEKTAEELVDALAKHNIVSLDTKVLSFEENNDAGERILYLDLSKAAGEYLKTMSREAECIILASVVNTFLENYDAGGICITVNGKPMKTKNAEYTEVLQKCTPEELFAMMEDYSAIDDVQEDGQMQSVPETVSEDGIDGQD